MADIAREQLAVRLRNLLGSGLYSDLKITCGANSYNVHKAIVCSQSMFFQNADNFPVGKEAAENSIDLPDDDPMAVKLLIGFFYESEYEPKLPVIAREERVGRWTVTVSRGTAYTYEFPHTCPGRCKMPESRVCPHHHCGNDCNLDCAKFACKICTAVQPPDADGRQLSIHSKMYEIGEKYDIPALKDLAREKFQRACAKYWADAQFPNAATHSLSTTPDSDMGLREVLCTTITDHLELLNNRAIQTLLKLHPQSAYTIIQKLAADLLLRKVDSM